MEFNPSMHGPSVPNSQILPHVSGVVVAVVVAVEVAVEVAVVVSVVAPTVVVGVEVVAAQRTKPV